MGSVGGTLLGALLGSWIDEEAAETVALVKRYWGFVRDGADDKPPKLKTLRETCAALGYSREKYETDVKELRERRANVRRCKGLGGNLAEQESIRAKIAEQERILAETRERFQGIVWPLEERKAVLERDEKEIRALAIKLVANNPDAALRAKKDALLKSRAQIEKGLQHARGAHHAEKVRNPNAEVKARKKWAGEPGQSGAKAVELQQELDEANRQHTADLQRLHGEVLHNETLLRKADADLASVDAEMAEWAP